MTFPVLLRIACIVIATKAGPCLDNQHCSDCDNTTGHCLTECYTGYFDLKCFSECDDHCIGNLCNQSADGSGRCTEGCVLGYQGLMCNIPCDSPPGTCTPCPGGCDGGYCQLGSSCVSGCVDSYYGTGCYNTCRTNCRRNPFTLDEQPLVIKLSDCHRKTGDCIFGCKHGWHGPRCSSQDDQTESVTSMTVGLPLAAVLVILLAVCCRFCRYRCCKRDSQAETVWNIGESYQDSEWSSDVEQHDSMMELEQATRGNQGVGCEAYDAVYGASEGGSVSDRRELHGGEYCSIEEGPVSDRRELPDAAYTSPLYVRETVVRYMRPVPRRHQCH